MPPKNRVVVEDLASSAASQVQVDTGFRDFFAQGRAQTNVGLTDFGGLSKAASARGEAQVKQHNQEFETALAQGMNEEEKSPEELAAMLKSYQTTESKRVTAGEQLGINTLGGQRGYRKSIGIRLQQTAQEEADANYDAYMQEQEVLAQSGKLTVVKEYKDFLSEAYDPLFGETGDLISRDDFYAVSGFSESRERNDGIPTRNNNARMDALLDLDHIVKTRKAIGKTLYLAINATDDETRDKYFADAIKLVDEGVRGANARVGPVADGAMSGMREAMGQIQAQPGVDDLGKARQTAELFEIASKGLHNSTWRDLPDFDLLHGEALSRLEAEEREWVREKPHREQAEVDAWKDEEGGLFEQFTQEPNPGKRQLILNQAERGELNLSRQQKAALRETEELMRGYAQADDEQLQLAIRERVAVDDYSGARALAWGSSTPEATLASIKISEDTGYAKYHEETEKGSDVRGYAAQFTDLVLQGGRMNIANDALADDLKSAIHERKKKFREDTFGKTKEEREELESTYLADLEQFNATYKESIDNAEALAVAAAAEARESLDTGKLVDLSRLSQLLSKDNYTDISKRNERLDANLTQARSQKLRDAEALRLTKAGDRANYELVEGTDGKLISQLSDVGRDELARITDVINEGADDILESDEARSNLVTMSKGEFQPWYQAEVRKLVKDVETGKFIGEKAEATKLKKADDVRTAKIEGDKAAVEAAVNAAEIDENMRNEEYTAFNELRPTVVPSEVMDSIRNMETWSKVQDRSIYNLPRTFTRHGVIIFDQDSLDKNVPRALRFGSPENTELVGLASVSSPRGIGPLVQQMSREGKIADPAALNVLWESTEKADRVRSGANTKIEFREATRENPIEDKGNHVRAGRSWFAFDSETGEPIRIADETPPTRFDIILRRAERSRDQAEGVIAAVLKQRDAGAHTVKAVSDHLDLRHESEALYHTSWLSPSDAVSGVYGTGLVIYELGTRHHPSSQRYFPTEGDMVEWLEENSTFIDPWKGPKAPARLPKKGSEADLLMQQLDMSIDEFVSYQYEIL